MLSDEKLQKIYIDAYHKASNETGLFGAGLVAIRAVAEAAVRAEREGAEPVAYIHRQGNHYEVAERFLNDDEKARGWTEEPLYLNPPQASATVPEWQPIETAPKDGESVLLLIENAEHPLYDDSLAVSIGCYGVAGEDRWSWAGWNWTHDEFCEGRGTPVGWMPLPAAHRRPGDEPSAHQVVVENVAAFNGNIPMPGDEEEQR